MSRPLLSTLLITTLASCSGSTTESESPDEKQTEAYESPNGFFACPTSITDVTTSDTIGGQHHGGKVGDYVMGCQTWTGMSQSAVTVNTPFQMAGIPIGAIPEAYRNSDERKLCAYHEFVNINQGQSSGLVGTEFCRIYYVDRIGY